MSGLNHFQLQHKNLRRGNKIRETKIAFDRYGIEEEKT